MKYMRLLSARWNFSHSPKLNTVTGGKSSLFHRTDPLPLGQPNYVQSRVTPNSECNTHLTACLLVGLPIWTSMASWAPDSYLTVRCQGSMAGSGNYIASPCEWKGKEEHMFNFTSFWAYWVTVFYQAWLKCWQNWNFWTPGKCRVLELAVPKADTRGSKKPLQVPETKALHLGNDIYADQRTHTIKDLRGPSTI